MKNCPICDSQTVTWTHPKFKMIFHVCSTCEFIFKDESQYPSPEEELKVYELHHNDDQNQGYVNFLTNFVDASVYPFIKSGEVLDFGSGPNPVLANILKDRYGYCVDIYDTYYAPKKVYLNKAYDLITSTEVVEHFYDPILMFSLISEHIKPGGYLAIMTLFHPKQQQPFFEWYYIRDTTHVSFYTPKTFIWIAKRFGFEVIYTNDHRYITLRKSEKRVDKYA